MNNPSRGTVVLRMASLASRSSLFALVPFALCTLAESAHAGLPPGVTLGAPVDVAAAHFVTVPESNVTFGTNGTDALACWASDGVACVRFTAAGAVLDASGIASSLGNTENGSSQPLVAWDGSAYVVMSTNQWQTLDPATGSLGTIQTIEQPWDPPGFYLEPQILAFGGGEVLAVIDDESIAEVVLYDESGNYIASFTEGGVPWGSELSAAWSNGVFLLSWISGEVVKGQRVGADGTILDPTPFNVDAAAAAADAATGTAYNTPVVGASNDGFLVAWLDGRRSTSGWQYDDLYGSLVGTDGTVTKGAFPIALESVSPAIAWDGAKWWVASPTIADATVSLQTIGADGTVGTAIPFAGVTPTGGIPAPSPALAATPTTIFAGLTTPTEVAGMRFSLAGTQLDNPPVPLSNQSVPALSPSLAAGPNGYLVTWAEALQSNEPQQYLAARLGLDGTPQDVPPLVLSGQSAVAWVGNGYLAVYATTSEKIGILQIPQSGPPKTTTILDPSATDAGTVYSSNPSIVCTTDRCLVSWASGYTTGAAAIIDAQGNVLTPPFATPAGYSEAGVSAAGATSFLTAYLPGSAVTIQYAGVVSAPISLATGDQPATVAWGDSEYLVALKYGSFARLSAGGALLANEAAPEELFGSAPSLIWDGRAFLAAFGSAYSLYGQPPAGLEIAATGPVSTAGSFAMFDSPAASSPLLASAAPGQLLAVALEPELQTPRLVARAVNVAPGPMIDGGPDGDDAGTPGNTPDAGDAGDASIASDGGEGSPDGSSGSPDATVNAPDGGGPDGSADDAGAPDANGSGGSVEDGGTGPILADAQVVGIDASGEDGGSSAASGGSSGCGCHAVSAGDAPNGAASLAWASVALAFLRRRRRSEER